MRFVHPEDLLKWPPANVINPVTRGPTIYIIDSLFFALATVAVFTRLYLRAFVRKYVGIDDYLILFAWFCALGDLATVFYAYHHFMWDRHAWDAMAPQLLIPGAKAYFILKIFWITASNAIRLSLLMLFYRLLRHTEILHHRTYRWTLHVTTFSVVAIYVTYMATIVFSCRNPAQYFQWPGTGYCIPEQYSDTILSAFNTLSEFIVASLPIPVVMALDMDKVQRKMIIGLLCLGYLVGIVGCVRTSYVWKGMSTNDLTWWVAPHWITSDVELCVAMICACAPSLRPFMGRLRWRKQTSFSARVPHKLNQALDSTTSTRLSGHASSDDPYAIEKPALWRIDLEGIDTSDGLGYTVTVTSGSPPAMAPNRFSKNAAEIRRGASNLMDWNFGPRVKQLVRHPVRWRDTIGGTSWKGDGVIEIVTSRTLEMRESFCEDGPERTWDHRNKYIAQAHIADRGISEPRRDLSRDDVLSNVRAARNFFYEDSEVGDPIDRHDV